MATHSTAAAALEAAFGRQLAIRRVPLASLTLDPANARLHPEKNLESLRVSLWRFGQVEPLVVLKESGRVIGGNGRLVAMKAMGWAECDIVELDISNLDATALGVALNRTAELAEWDEQALASLLRSDGVRTHDSSFGNPQPEVRSRRPFGPRLMAATLRRALHLAGHRRSSASS